MSNLETQNGNPNMVVMNRKKNQEIDFGPTITRITNVEIQDEYVNG